MKIKVNISGLSSGFGTLKHGFHVHQKAITVISDDETVNCNSLGDHYNPLNQTHGGLSSITRHIGDYGNVNLSNLIFKIHLVFQKNLI